MDSSNSAVNGDEWAGSAEAGRPARDRDMVIMYYPCIAFPMHVSTKCLQLPPAIAWPGFAPVPVLVDPQAHLLLTALHTAASALVITQRHGVLERPVAAIMRASHLVGIVTLTVPLVLVGA